MKNENQNIQNTIEPTGTIENTQNTVINEAEPLPMGNVPEPAEETPISGIDNVSVTSQMEPLPMDNSVISEPSKKKKVILPVIIITSIVLALGALFVIFILPNLLFSGKKAIEKEITEIFKMSRDTLDENEGKILSYDLDKDSVGIEGTLTIDSDYKNESYDLTKLKDYEIDYSGVIDKKNNAASFTARLDKKNTNLIAIDGFAEGETMYISLGDIFNKIITKDSDKEINNLEISKTQDLKDIKKLLDKTETAIKNSIKEEDITTKDESGYKVVTYKFEQEKIEKEILTAFVNDKEIIELLSDMTAQDESYIKKYLNDEIETINSTTDYEEVTVVLYLKGFRNEFKKTEITSSNNKIVVEKENDIYNFSNDSISYGPSFKGTYNKKEKSLNATINDEITIIIKDDKEKTTVDFSYIDDNQSIIINAVITNKVESNKQKNEAVVKVEYIVDGETMNATIKNNFNIEKNKKVERELKNASTVKYEDLTYEELNEINDKITSKFVEIINDIMPGMY